MFTLSCHNPMESGVALQWVAKIVLSCIVSFRYGCIIITLIHHRHCLLSFAYLCNYPIQLPISCADHICGNFPNLSISAAMERDATLWLRGTKRRQNTLLQLGKLLPYYPKMCLTIELIIMSQEFDLPR